MSQTALRVAAGLHDMLVASYERLRSGILGRALDGSVEPGMAVLMRKGMGAWIRLCSIVPAAQAPSMDATPEDVLPDSTRGEMMRALVEMALGIGRLGAQS